MTAPALQAPYPYFGGKRKVAALIWKRFGDVRSYVEPFFGSGAVLLGRPQPFEGLETVNDRDGLISNFWRALAADPEAVAHHADWIVNENDLHARHAWLVGQAEGLTAKLEGDPEYYDAKIAGWWCWGMACWIGSGFCSGKGPWQIVEGEDGIKRLEDTGDRPGVKRNRLALGDAGQGVNRECNGLTEYFARLADRFRRVRVCCGDWTRVMGGDSGEATQWHFAVGVPVAVFLDPPYADTAERCEQIYRTDCTQVAHAVREWAVAHGEDRRYRIALCGYEGEHVMPASWQCVQGKPGSSGGYGCQNKNGYANAGRERLWFSPGCLDPEDAMPLFAGLNGWHDDEDEPE